MKEKFQDHRFKPESTKLINQANDIIAEYTAQGYVLTLRQLYYQCVSRSILENKDKNYDRLGSLLNDARYAGLIDWAALEDRTRNRQGGSHWDSPASVISSAAYSYAIDKWADQSNRIEIWVEKEALAGVVQKAATLNDVDFLACRGYMSASEMYTAAQRARRYRRSGQEMIVIYLGDHDPSGIDMSESDIPKRFELFLRKYDQSPIEVRRVALNWEQIEEYEPPPNPAKVSDSRFAFYEENYGDESWELDALEPNVMVAIIQTAIDEYKDIDAFNSAIAREKQERRILTAASRYWDSVAGHLARHGMIED